MLKEDTLNNLISSILNEEKFSTMKTIHDILHEKAYMKIEDIRFNIENSTDEDDETEDDADESSDEDDDESEDEDDDDEDDEE